MLEISSIMLIWVPLLIVSLVMFLHVQLLWLNLHLSINKNDLYKLFLLYICKFYILYKIGLMDYFAYKYIINLFLGIKRSKFHISIILSLILKKKFNFAQMELEKFVITILMGSIN